ncbi:NAD(P)-binding domain-containing protein [Dyadobacter sp. LJ53]|uniref:NADPH-dependent F420 reductase n=1 Tax=Dyadobacter chenwenxiniae TaxID=2906456 RepID=UPI001F165C73|nr:NAD(P)-binding domain-containing protein [Dyadobacter chenwenxiniae]MCF0049312.1 NAD(P)-binding domain-containing protein [Dyadobacter chenwenxiniae]
MNTIGIIGAGMIGSQIARLSVNAGLNVLISNSRGPQTLETLIKELGSKARAVTSDQAVAQADIVVLAIPFGIYASLLPEQYASKIIIDTTNYYPERDGVMQEVQTDQIASSELVQGHLKGARLVKALSNMDWVRLYQGARPLEGSRRSAVPIASDDQEAKSVVTEFLGRIGYDTVDMGTLKDSWRSEPTMPVYVAPYLGKPDAELTGQQTRDWFMNAPERLVDKNEVKRLLESAVRHENMVGMLARTVGASL